MRPLTLMATLALLLSPQTAAAQFDPNRAFELGIEILRQMPQEPAPTYPREQQPRPLPQTVIADIQRQLHELGYDPGAVDGIEGAKTRKALAAWQRDRGLPITGQPTRKILQILRDEVRMAGAPGNGPTQMTESANPSFDCAQANAPDEQAICASPELAARDRVLNEAFQRAVANAAPDAQDRMYRDQQAWLNARRSCGANTNCLGAMMDGRIAVLTELAGTLPRHADPVANNASHDTLAQSTNKLAGAWTAERACGRYGKTEFRLFVTEFDGVSYALLRSIDRTYGDERIRHDWYEIPDSADVNQEPITPEPVHVTISGSRYKFRILDSNERDSIVIDHAICRDMPMRRVVRSASDGEPSPFKGNWKGYVDACSSFRDFPYDVQFSFRELPGGVILAKAQSPFDGRNVHPFFFGERSGEETLITLHSTGRSEQWVKLEFVRGDNRLYGNSKSMFGKGTCDYVELAPVGIELAASSGSEGNTDPATTPALDVRGEWEGRAVCGDTQGRVLLSVEEAAADRYQGSIEYSFGHVLSNGLLVQPLVGEKNPDGSYHFALDLRRARQTVAGMSPDAFSLSGDPGGDPNRLIGEYGSGTCSTLALSRRTADSLSAKVRGLDGGPGSFYASRRPRDRCEAIAEWLGRKNQEYPDWDFRNSPSGQTAAKLILLFADDEFAPVFGRPYESLDRRSGRELLAEVRRVCRSDPVRRELIDDFFLVERYLVAADSDRGNRSGASVKALVRETRRLRNLIEQVMTTLPPESHFDAAIPVLVELRREIERASGSLWPSEMETAEAKIRDELGRYAFAKADAQLGEIRSLQDRIAQLRAMTAVANGETDYHQFLLPDDASGIYRGLADEQERIVEDMHRVPLASVRALEPSLPALSELDELEGELKPTLALLIADVRQRFDREIASKRQSILDTVVSARLSELDQLSADQKGLQDQRAWLERFEEDFSRFAESATYVAAIERFVASRKELLREAVAQFETELATRAANGTVEVDALMESYLSWEGDRRLPVSLEYQIMAELALAPMDQ